MRNAYRNRICWKRNKNLFAGFMCIYSVLVLSFYFCFSSLKLWSSSCIEIIIIIKIGSSCSICYISITIIDNSSFIIIITHDLSCFHWSNIISNYFLFFFPLVSLDCRIWWWGSSLRLLVNVVYSFFFFWHLSQVPSKTGFFAADEPI